MKPDPETNLLSTLSGRDALGLLEIINDCLHVVSEQQLAQLIDRKLRCLLDFRYATYVSAKRREFWGFQALNIHYPEEFLGLYQQTEFTAADPIFLAALRDPGVNYWRDLLDKYPCNEKLEHLTTEFGLDEGYQWGLHNQRGDRFGSFSICDTKIERSPRTEAILSLLIPHVHQAYQRLSVQKQQTNHKLTRRETEILNWAKDGRTSWEISVILSISERTVRFHLENIMKKLGAMSRTHAVAIALEEGLIDNF